MSLSMGWGIAVAISFWQCWVKRESDLATLFWYLQLLNMAQVQECHACAHICSFNGPTKRLYLPAFAASSECRGNFKIVQISLFKIGWLVCVAKRLGNPMSDVIPLLGIPCQMWSVNIKSPNLMVCAFTQWKNFEEKAEQGKTLLEKENKNTSSLIFLWE